MLWSCVWLAENYSVALCTQGHPSSFVSLRSQTPHMMPIFSHNAPFAKIDKIGIYVCNSNCSRYIQWWPNVWYLVCRQEIITLLAIVGTMCDRMNSLNWGKWWGPFKFPRTFFLLRSQEDPRKYADTTISIFHRHYEIKSCVLILSFLLGHTELW